MAKQKKYTGIVVPGTHWDRAWYKTFQQFRLELVKIFDKLLDILETEPGYKNFTFDGQTVVLEDYLEIRPENRALIEKHVKSGKLSVGPWYILPDEFLVSGEALIRNLEIGHRVARSFGRVMKAGYIPDPFGHVSQLPAIIDGFGLDSAIFTRGAGKWMEKTGPVFKWIASDGSTWIYGIEQYPGGYANLARWGGSVFDSRDVDMDAALQRVEDIVDKVKETPTYRHSHILFNNGVDHAPAQRAVPKMIKHVNSNSKDIHLIQADYEEFTKRIISEGKALNIYQGEIHSGHRHCILSGTFSARMWIKQSNWKIQKLLEEVSEPAACRSLLLGNGAYGAFIETAWKHLLKCHPHDDICGCSVDETHRDNEFNFKAAAEIGRSVAEDALKLEAYDRPAPENAIKKIAVYGGSFIGGPTESRGQVKFGRETGIPKLHAETSDGRKLPVIARRAANAEMADITLFDPDMPPCAVRTYALKKGESGWKAPDMKCGVKSIENTFYKVKFNSNGTINVTDRETGMTFRNMNMFEDTEDCGDEYDYSPLPENSLTLDSLKTSAKIAEPEITPWSASISAQLIMRIPKSLTSDRKRRSAKTTSLGISTTVKLYSNVKRVDFSTTIDNTAKDHRLRAVFPAPLKTGQVHAAQHFDVLERPSAPTGADYVGNGQPEMPTQHMDEFVSISDGKNGLTLASVGLPEYEARRGGSGTDLVLTLLRSCGWLSLPDLVTRKSNAGPQWPSPGAQCLGTNTFEYSIIPHSGDWLDSRAFIEARKLSSESVLVEVPECIEKTAAAEKSRLEEPLFEVDTPETVVTCAKCGEDGKSLLLRFFNISGKTVKAKIRFGFPAARVFRARIDGTRAEKIPVSRDNCAKVSAAGKEIVTLLVYPEFSSA